MSVLYLAKLNLTSKINDILSGKLKMSTVKNKIVLGLEANKEYHREDIRTVLNDEDDNTHEEITYEADYWFDVLSLQDDGLKRSIYGQLAKKSNIFINTEIKNGKLIRKEEPNIERIRFCYDVERELIAFHTTQRFGYKEILIAFNSLFNKLLKKRGYTFDLDLVRKSMSFEDIQKQLKKMKNIDKISISIKTPNPDDDLLDDMLKKGSEIVDSYKEGNITKKSIILESKAKKGLKVDTDAINEELEKLNLIHESISTEVALQNGYAKIIATSPTYTLSSEDSAPYKGTYDDKLDSLIEFGEQCKKFIKSFRNR
jgi:hypothetical protein